MLKKLQKEFKDNPERVKSLINKMKIFQNRKNFNINRIRTKINTLTTEEFDTLFTKFLHWELQKETYYFETLCKEDSSIVFESLLDVIQLDGVKKENKEPFNSGSWLYKGYLFNLYIGQGAIWQISKNGISLF